MQDIHDPNWNPTTETNPQTPHDWHQLAQHVLAACKRIDPTFYRPDSAPGMAQAWATIMAHHGPNPHTWPDLPNAYAHGVSRYHAHHDTRPKIANIIQETKNTLNHWERTNPTYRQARHHALQTAQNQRDHRIAQGLPPNTKPQLNSTTATVRQPHRARDGAVSVSNALNSVVGHLMPGEG